MRMGYALQPEGWLGSVREAHRHHLLTYLAFLLGRGPAEALWVVSLLPVPYGRPLLEQSLTWHGLVVYHTLAAFFTWLGEPYSL